MADNLERAVKIIGFVVGIIAVLQYWDGIKREKISSAYDFFSDYNSGEMLRARSTLNALFEELRKPRRGTNSNETTKLIDQLIRMILTLGEGENHIHYRMVLNYFDAVYRCAELGRCDKTTVLTLFSQEAKNLLKILLPAISFFENTLSETPNGHGLGLRCIAEGFSTSGCFQSVSSIERRRDARRRTMSDAQGRAIFD